MLHKTRARNAPQRRTAFLTIHVGFFLGAASKKIQTNFKSLVEAPAKQHKA
jgi:hypothetical protein